MIFKKNMAGTTTRAKMIQISALFCIPFMLFLMLCLMYSNNTYWKEISETNRNNLTVYQTKISVDIDSVVNAVSQIIANDADFQCLCYPLSDLDTYLNLHKVMKKFESAMTVSDFMDLLCIYVLSSNKFDGAYSDKISNNQKNSISGYLRSYIKDNKENALKNWTIHRIGEEYYVLKILKKKDVYCICAINLNNISISNKDGNLLFYSDGILPISMINSVKAAGIQITQDREVIYRNGRERLMMIQSYVKEWDCYITEVIPFDSIWSSNMLSVILLLCILMFLVLILIYYRIIRNTFFLPMEQMLGTMEDISNGQVEKSLTIDSDFREYKKIETSFNRMFDKIKGLRIYSYEQEIKTQKLELQYYQMQIQPHFYLNCLKNLYGMAEAHQYEQIQEMILAFSTYLRSIYGNHSLMVPLKKELESLDAYVCLQKYKCKVAPIIKLEIDDKLMDFQIPPLSVITFVENSIKYYRSKEAVLQIIIRAKLIDTDDGNFVNLTILDNGDGFDKEILEKLNSGDSEFFETHIGINNVKQRFCLLYGQDCIFMHGNMNGALVEIFIPYSP